MIYRLPVGHTITASVIDGTGTIKQVEDGSIGAIFSTSQSYGPYLVVRDFIVSDNADVTISPYTDTIQEATAVAITGGTIDGTAIGGTTPAAGAFTTATATSATVSAANAGCGLRLQRTGTYPGDFTVFSGGYDTPVWSVYDNTTEATRMTLDATGLSVTGGVVATTTVTTAQYKLSALNTAPASASATGILGEIRIDDSYIYVCTATDTWKRAAITTW